MICSIIGHRDVVLNETNITNVSTIFEKLINNHNEVFLFGSNSNFNNQCYSIISKLKMKYTNIKRIWVRAEYPILPYSYNNYVKSHFEYTFFSNKLKNSKKFIYISRNKLMIDYSDVCVFFYDYSKPNKHSGTKIAYEYAMKKIKK